jgi:hypothetical protein
MDEISPPYTVRLTNADQLSATDRSAAEVRFATALEAHCTPQGGIVEVYGRSEAALDKWAEEEITGPDDPGPTTNWDEACRAAEARAWEGHAKPDGASFEVEVHAPLKYGSMFVYDASKVPF